MISNHDYIYLKTIILFSNTIIAVMISSAMMILTIIHPQVPIDKAAPKKF